MINSKFKQAAKAVAARGVEHRIRGLVSQWEKCVELAVDYVEQAYDNIHITEISCKSHSLFSFIA